MRPVRRGGRKKFIKKLEYQLKHGKAYHPYLGIEPDNSAPDEEPPRSTKPPCPPESPQSPVPDLKANVRESYRVSGIDCDTIPRLPNIRRGFSPRDPRPAFYRRLHAEILHHYYGASTPPHTNRTRNGKPPTFDRLREHVRNSMT
ncbi:hypothetical protein EAI_13500 [Harpegnathos saltator]|uniref:Uncharacterized protein n=1 Tax=Harpegnathos saltator TaxID=610380 RepID=E2C0F8_HARSA|nr:hypothetical protein EAI_13500 [Harpegnathos saltator]